MNKKTVLIAVGVGLALLGVVALTLLLISEPQDTRSRADNNQPLVVPTSPVSPSPAQAAQNCPAPAQVTNVEVQFPNCVGDVCNFTEAACVWDSIAGATKYKLTVTEVETGRVVKDEEVEASITKTEYPINQNQTYKCDVAAVNSCGVAGVAGTHSLLCEVDALIETPTPSPLPSKPPVQVACGFQCATTADCSSGLTCAKSSGAAQGYCAMPAYESACRTSPSVTNCCTAPTQPPILTATPVPTLVPTGIVSDTIAVGAGLVLLILLGLTLVML